MKLTRKDRNFLLFLISLIPALVVASAVVGLVTNGINAVVLYIVTISSVLPLIFWIIRPARITVFVKVLILLKIQIFCFAAALITVVFPEFSSVSSTGIAMIVGAAVLITLFRWVAGLTTYKTDRYADSLMPMNGYIRAGTVVYTILEQEGRLEEITAMVTIDLRVVAIGFNDNWVEIAQLHPKKFPEARDYIRLEDFTDSL